MLDKIQKSPVHIAQLLFPAPVKADIHLEGRRQLAAHENRLLVGHEVRQHRNPQPVAHQLLDGLQLGGAQKDIRDIPPLHAALVHLLVLVGIGLLHNEVLILQIIKADFFPA